jgi:hypothetical protein
MGVAYASRPKRESSRLTGDRLVCILLLSPFARSGSTNLANLFWTKQSSIVRSRRGEGRSNSIARSAQYRTDAGSRLEIESAKSFNRWRTYALF